MRKKTSMPRLGASPHRQGAEGEHERRRPCRSACARTAWRTSRSAAARWRWRPGRRSAPRWLSSTPADRLPAMCGRATLATLVSSTSMNVASMTVSAISHGTVAGLPVAGGAVGAGLPAAIHRTCTCGTTDIPGASGWARVGRLVEDDLDRHALDDLDVVAGGVFRRQQAEAGAGAGLDAVDVAAERPCRGRRRRRCPPSGPGACRQLGLLEVGHHPDIRRDHGQQGLAGRDVAPGSTDLRVTRPAAGAAMRV